MRPLNPTKIKKAAIIFSFTFVAACKTTYATKFRVATPKGNYYVSEYVVKNDSIYFEEFNRDGKSRGKHTFPYVQVSISK